MGQNGATVWDRFYPRFLGGRAAIGLLAVRVVAGTAFMWHGSGKIQQPFSWMPSEAPVPGILQALAAVSEFGGGLAWIAGLLVPAASAGIACTMAFAIGRHVLVKHDPFVDPGGSSWELAAAYLCIALLLLCAGPGTLSVDRLLFGPRPAS